MSVKQCMGWTFFLVLGLAPVGVAFQNWERSAPSETSQTFSAALPHPSDSGKTLLASTDQIFEARSGTQDWKKLAPARSGIRILRLYHFPEFPEEVFVLADRGLFRFYLKNPAAWQPLRDPLRGESFTAFAVSPRDPRRWFLGSTFHLYESRDLGKSWRISSALQEDPVCFLKFSGESLYAASHKTLYVSADGSYFKKTLSLVAEEAEPSFETPSEEETQTASCPFYDIFQNADAQIFWAATERGVFQSLDGETWKALPQSGLISPEIRHLTYVSETNQLFAGTPDGIFAFREKDGRWKNVYQTFGGEEVKGLIVDETQSRLYGVTTRGFVWHPLLPDSITLPQELDAGNKILFQRLIALEPAARDIHRAVIRYANTKNSKINRWQAESRLRAFFPSVSFGKDLSRGNNIDLDRGSTNERDVFIEGPEDISRGWDVSVSWDLGDFIFSSNQTSIDSREKLMVELRHDLTQEATRLYYERRRLQTEAALLAAASEQEHLSRLIQIEELTALLDAMTDGYMTQRLEILYRDNPELRALWEFRASAPQTG
jgi:hypothetical protein